ncbi:hypothetical protein DSO57_1025142 [Entomophthora muscae]|uniref:Uncharacterized protein n=1 Tax=Entomophthora muscae TaxID=34485 RepID=A0ACC2RTJ1_9FUNG|nr:hypothetical protein DSO57_1025142 [Entomophthora muscae]
MRLAYHSRDPRYNRLFPIKSVTGGLVCVLNEAALLQLLTDAIVQLSHCTSDVHWLQPHPTHTKCTVRNGFDLPVL